MKITFPVLIAVAAALLGVSACAEAPRIDNAIIGTEATIVNMTRKPIARIVYQKCNTSPEMWQPLGVPQLEVGQTITLHLPPGCVDLNAYADDGKLAGTQRQLQTQYPFRWALQ